MRGVLYDDAEDKVLADLTLAMDTKTLSTLSYYDNNGTKGNFSFNLKIGGLVLRHCPAKCVS